MVKIHVRQTDLISSRIRGVLSYTPDEQINYYTVTRRQVSLGDVVLSLSRQVNDRKERRKEKETTRGTEGLRVYDDNQ